ncbi:MAG: sodium:solute symporter family protein [Planctomycetia bacterium]|nr:sodium:solute symporter family protein [Planctomycetia bacterium]
MILGLKSIDISVIVAYFAAVLAIGFWAARRVKSEEDFFLGGRRFGKGLLVMHWLCTGTHSEMAVQVAGATARVGLGGIWYQWMWLFSTPFYWFIAPITRRMRVITTGDFFRIRYGRSLEMLYSVVALVYFMQSMALLLRGAAAAISGATGGELPMERSVVALSIMFATYVMAGGLVAAAFTDVLQGVMIIALSLMLVPAGLALVGGLSGLHEQLPAAMFSITAPEGMNEGDPWFVLAMSALGLTGIVAQPHVMAATASGRAETEARVGMTYGNFIKRLLTIAWAFTGLIALAAFPEIISGHAAGSEELKHASETLFGRAIQEFLGDGWRGLMIACLIAGVTSAETFMVVGSAIFTRNFYVHAVPGQTDAHYLWVGRAASAAMLALSILMAFYAGSVTQLLVASVQVVGLLGGPFWLGVFWRRANTPGVWASFVGTLLAWGAMSLDEGSLPNIYPVQWAASVLTATGEMLHVRGVSKPAEILITLSTEFGLLVLVSLLTRPHPPGRLDPFFARLLTPVGKEPEVQWIDAPADLPESATLGMDGVKLDYRKSSSYAHQRLLRWGIEIPRMTWFDWGGFVLAWILVGALLALMLFLTGYGA